MLSGGALRADAALEAAGLSGAWQAVNPAGYLCERVARTGYRVERPGAA